jgi:GNAT superfamily N-acetyltransferase
MIRREVFGGWSPALESAATALPESEMCSRDLLRRVCATSMPKRIVLARDADGPVAIVPFFEQGNRWEPMLQWVVPATLGLVRAGADVLAAFPQLVRTHVGWWRQSAPPPASFAIYNVQHVRSHGMPLADDPVPHWKSSGHWNTVRQSRNKCTEYALRVNAPGMAEWTIRNWEGHWRATTGGSYPEMPVRLVAAAELEGRGVHHTLTLHDGEKPLAGHTFLRHGLDVVWQVTYRDVEYDRQGVGTRLMDLAFDWARALGARNIDLGGLHAYKGRWAPELGDRYEFDHLHPAVRALRAGARRVRERLRALPPPAAFK